MKYDYDKIRFSLKFALERMKRGRIQDYEKLITLLESHDFQVNFHTNDKFFDDWRQEAIDHCKKNIRQGYIDLSESKIYKQ